MIRTTTAQITQSSGSGSAKADRKEGREGGREGGRKGGREEGRRSSGYVQLPTYRCKKSKKAK